MSDQPDNHSFNRWAVIIGISKYEDSSLNLGFADRDARAFYDLIRSPSGGGFKDEHVTLLTNEKATTRGITQALRSFLKRPAREDLVIIYFACHGSPDPERPSNVYLLSHDVDRDDIAGTGVPMSEIDASIRSILHSEKVVIIADTCHSAAIGGGPGLRSAPDSNRIVNQYMDDLRQAKDGIALITSCEANETAQEDAFLGGGHGVFTHFLLEGMRGAADSRPKNGQVTLGELFEYVRESVKEATGHRQHPSIGTTQFDRNLPMAVPGLGRSRELVEKAQASIDADDLVEAEALLREALKMNPKSHAAASKLKKVKYEKAQRKLKLKERQQVIRQYFESKELTTAQFNIAMNLLDKTDDLSNDESRHRTYLLSLVDEGLDVSIYKDSIGISSNTADVASQPAVPVLTTMAQLEDTEDEVEDPNLEQPPNSIGETAASSTSSGETRQTGLTFNDRVTGAVVGALIGAIFYLAIITVANVKDELLSIQALVLVVIFGIAGAICGRNRRVIKNAVITAAVAWFILFLLILLFSGSEFTIETSIMLFSVTGFYGASFGLIVGSLLGTWRENRLHPK